MPRSVADELRDEQLGEILKLTPAERMRFAERLGEEALQLFMTAKGVSRDEAIARIKQQRRAGRTPSVCMDQP